MAPPPVEWGNAQPHRRLQPVQLCSTPCAQLHKGASAAANGHNCKGASAAANGHNCTHKWASGQVGTGRNTVMLLEAFAVKRMHVQCWRRCEPAFRPAGQACAPFRSAGRWTVRHPASSGFSIIHEQITKSVRHFGSVLLACCFVPGSARCCAGVCSTDHTWQPAGVTQNTDAGVSKAT